MTTGRIAGGHVRTGTKRGGPGPAARPTPEALARLRLVDRVQPPVMVLFVGINPGVRSATSGHHFAGSSNRFWKLLHESGLVPVPVTHVDDDRLPEWGYGVTNLVPRPTPGIDTLRPEEYREGTDVLRDKVRHWQPAIVALVGVTLYRAIFGVRGGAPVTLGFQQEPMEGARVFVLPNPSGRNANFSYDEMLGAFARLQRAVQRARRLAATKSSGVGGRGAPRSGSTLQAPPDSVAADPDTQRRRRRG